MGKPWTDLVFSNIADHTALASSAVEATLLAGTNQQPRFPAFFFDGPEAKGKAVSIVARGVFSNTGTPTLTFQVRLGSTQGATNYGGTSLGVSAAITTASGVTSKFWELGMDLICNTPGQGASNTTLNCSGYVKSMSGFGTPFIYPLEPTTPDTATWTATIDSAVANYLNLSATWSASSSSNSIVCKYLRVVAWN